MYKDWNLKSEANFIKSYSKIDWLIDLVTSIRSTKVKLNISPGSFINVSTAELSTSKISIINDNLNVLKRLGRITDINNSQLRGNGVKIIVGGETVNLYFDQNINLKEQKKKILSKVINLEEKINLTAKKLKNKSFLKNAPKQIIDAEKKALKDNKIELKKLNSIINSIKD